MQTGLGGSGPGESAGTNSSVPFGTSSWLGGDPARLIRSRASLR